MLQLRAANKLHRLSHTELSHGGKPDPNLWRLLGHMSIYDNVERWRTENAAQIHIAGTAQRNAARISQARKTTYQSNVPSSETPLKLRTLAEFQAAIRAHMPPEAEKETTVSTEEVSSDDEDTSDEAMSDESDDESTWSEEDDPIVEFIRMDTAASMEQDAMNDVISYKSTSENALHPTEKQ